MKRLRYSLFILFFLSGTVVSPQVPVGAVFDVGISTQNTITLTAETLMQFLLRKEEGFASIIGDVNTFFAKARTILNASIKNMRLIRSIVDTYSDILEQYHQSIYLLHQDLDQDGNGIDDLEVLEKWQHIQILLGLLGEAEKVIELLTNLIEDDALSIDDKGRIVLLQETYKDVIRIKTAILVHRRRVNQILFKYQREKRYIKSFEALFE